MLSYSSSICFAAEKVEADEALVRAEEDLASAYVAVEDAGIAGANVSVLLVRLDITGGLLSDAYNAYRLGDFDRAYTYAVNCSDRIAEIVSEALGLKSQAERAYNDMLLLTAGASSAGLSVLFVLSLFVWRFLKKKYVERFLKMKPQVRDAE